MPKWVFEVPFVLTEFGPTAKYDATSKSDTIALLNILKNKYNAALFPSASMKPDAIIPILHNYKVYLIVFGFKYYSSDIVKSIMLKNEEATDLSKVYLKETSEGVQQDEEKSRLFYSYFTGCQAREYIFENSKDRICKKKSSEIRVKALDEAFAVENVLRVHVCLPNAPYSNKTNCFKNGDIAVNYNLESIKDIISENAYKFLLFTFRNYIADQEGSTILENPAKRQRKESSSAFIQHQVE